MMGAQEYFERAMNRVKENGSDGMMDVDYCWSSDDCRGPKYRGGCCSDMWVAEGDIDRLPELAMAMSGVMERGMGVCTPEFVVDYFEDVEETNMYDYHEYLFNEPMMWDQYTKDMNPKPETFEEWYDEVEQWMDTSAWWDVEIGAKCMDGGRGDGRMRGGKGGDGGFIDWSEDRDRMIMTGVDGSKIYIEMGATKLFASVAALGAAMYLY